MRVGVGYDSHRFDPAVPLVLGGVRIPDHPGLRGHSDGDAVAHALIDALLGAAALGDIGALFPDSDPAWAGADSLGLLHRTVERVGRAGWRPVNADVSVLAETPRIAPHATAMRRTLAGALGVPEEYVSVKGKSLEGLGWIGRREGLAVIAVVLLEPHPAGGGCGSRRDMAD